MTGSVDMRWTRGERRELVFLLRRLLRGAVGVARPDGMDGPVTIGEGRRLDADLLRRAAGFGLLREADGHLMATGETAAFLRRSLLPDAEAFAGQHRIAAPQTVELDGRRQPVRRNLLESPLSGLARLKDRQGAAFLPVEAVEAGERLLCDFTRAGLQPQVTARWEPRLSGRTKGEAGGRGELSDSAIDARARFTRAVEAIGPELSGVAVDVCCFAKGLETVERERQWPARSAKLLLRAALLALARHYAPPPAGERRRHHWGADGYRPPIG